MYWNPAATATLTGFNSSSSYTGILATSNEHATGGVFVTPLTPTSTDVGTDAIVPASYLTYQYNDRLYLGLALNAPFGLVTKPDNTWSGSPIATTTRVFSIDANPTVAYKLTPEWTVGAGLQVEYLETRLDRGALYEPLPPLGLLTPVTPSRSSKFDDWGVGATAGVLWQPLPGTSLGVGYRSAVTVDVSGLYTNGAFFNTATLTPVAGFGVNGTASITLPDEVTFSVRQAVTQQLTLLGTVEWDDWSRLGNVNVTNPFCSGGVCETLNLNYRDGWFFSVGAEYAYNPLLTFRAGVGYEISPITDSIRDILLPDSNRVHLNIGATYKWSDKLSLIAAYSHIFFESAPFCEASPQTGSTHCTAFTPPSAVLLTGSADTSVDIVSLGVNYKISGPEPLEPLK
jgi:long-chain fatty acid transport protein